MPAARGGGSGTGSVLGAAVAGGAGVAGVADGAGAGAVGVVGAGTGCGLGGTGGGTLQAPTPASSTAPARRLALRAARSMKGTMDRLRQLT
ncbi:MAG: hypothetical protein AMXMBFR78_11730 [Rubrivivax sp.]